MEKPNSPGDIDSCRNQTEQEMVRYLADLKFCKQDFHFLELRTDAPGWCADVALDAHYELLEPACIFDGCSDAQARAFLEAFLAEKLSVSWAIQVQLAKLLATRGRLVGDIMDRLWLSGC